MTPAGKVVHFFQKFREVNTQLQNGERYGPEPSRRRSIIHECVAESAGTMLLVLVGTAGNAQGTLFNNPNVSSSPAGGWLFVALGWGIGLGLGVWIATGTSEGHINPAVTIAYATFRDFPWWKVPVYIISQLLGGIIGASITYANYFQAINVFEGGSGKRSVPGTASIFGTYAVSYLSNATAFWDEFLGTFILLLALLVVKDRDAPQPPGLIPLVLSVTLFGIGMTFGAQTGFAVNPARDLGPRILTAMAGYGREVFNFRHQYWLWCGVLAPILGALVATFIYDMFLSRAARGFAAVAEIAAPENRNQNHPKESRDSDVV